MQFLTGANLKIRDELTIEELETALSALEATFIMFQVVRENIWRTQNYVNVVELMDTVMDWNQTYVRVRKRLEELRKH